MNTGWKGGVFLFLEQKLGRRLFRIECQLHLNELPMRKLAKHLIGKSQSGVRLRGKIFSNILIATSLPVSNDFVQISCEDFFELDPKVLQDLSSDQKYCYYTWKVIVRVYFTNWILVKSNSDITMGSTNFLKFLELFRRWEPTDISEVILKDVKDNIIWNSYWSCPQKIILGLLTHDDEERRRDGIKLILDIRKKYPQENISTLARKKPIPNVNATSLLQLIREGAVSTSL